MEINVIIDGDFRECPEEDWLREIVGQVLIAQGIGSDVELGLVITTQERIQDLNRSYRGEDKPTDVLSFYMTSATGEINGVESPPFVAPPDGVCHLGEVIISYPQAVLQAEEHRHSVNKEIAILIIHGVLHLLGFDHAETEEERQMKAREEAILSQVGGVE